MGTDKSLIRYQDKPQRHFLFDMLSESCEKVFTSCRNEQEIPVALYPVVDRFDFEGPMNGILSAFTLHPEKAWMVIAIDLPNVTGKTLEMLKGQRDPTKLATCFFDTKQNAPEPLLTLWEPAAFPLLLKNATEGNISPRAFLRTADVKFIKSPDENLFLNVNYPHQLQEWIKRG